MVLRKGYGKPDYIVCHAKSCDNVSSPFNLVESRILSSLNQWLGEYKAQWKYAEQIQRKKDENNSSAAAIQKALNKNTEVKPLNIWLHYHCAQGEVHCGTAAIRKMPENSPSWWTLPAYSGWK